MMTRTFFFVSVGLLVLSACSAFSPVRSVEAANEAPGVTASGALDHAEVPA